MSDHLATTLKYMGAASGAITLAASCPPDPSPTPNNQCFNLAPAPAPTTFDAQDIPRIKLPKRATRTTPSGIEECKLK